MPRLDETNRLSHAPGKSASCSVHVSSTVLRQVGYGLAHDLWAIAAALGDTGYGCVAVVEPQLDIDALHRQLHKAHTAGVKKVCFHSTYVLRAASP